MKKIIFTLGIIIAIGGIILGATNAYFADIEKSENNTAVAGTFDIDDEGTWTKSYAVSDIYPGEAPREIEFTLRNKGNLPMRVWMVIRNVSNEENGVSDSEQDYYNGGPAKNDIDSVMVYALEVDGNLALEQEAGITVSQIKEHYVNLVKTDKPFKENDGDGILYPEHTIQIAQKFYLPPETENWAQSDIMSFEIEILAQQVDAQEPIKQLSFIQNKEDALFETDGVIGVLKYDSYAEEFNYDFIATNLDPNIKYDLIYYGDDWAGDHPGYAINHGFPNSDGILVFSDSENIGIDLPQLPDTNHPYGAKIWLVKSSYYNRENRSVNSWTPDGWLFDNWPGLIRYTKSTDGNPSQPETVNFTDLGASPQFGLSPYDNYDYSQADVNFAYDTPALSKLSGTITATELKPNMTYQTKFIGKPTCAYGISGNDSASEYIGYKGRWTCLDCVCSGAGCNRTDAAYEANKALPDGHGDKECIAGYLAWDYFTADNSGNVSKTIQTANSYHVLWCSGGTCGQSNNSQLSIQSPYPTCAENDVNGEIERFTCDGLVLDTGIYDLDFVLTEESFHQSTYGVWTTVMGTDINFEIE